MTAVPLAVSISAETAPPCSTPVDRSPTSRESHGITIVAVPAPSSVSSIAKAAAWGKAAVN